jgi:plastocyanin
MRRCVVIGAAATLLAIPTLALGRATTTVKVAPGGANAFGPNTATNTVGAGSIHWQWDPAAGSANHNVREANKLFYSGSPTNSHDNPSGYTITPSAGSFHYYCEPHARFMVGTIYVRPAVFNRTATSFGVRWSTGANQTGDRFDVRYRVDGGAWTMWRNNVAFSASIFGSFNRPVPVTAGHTYEVQARSAKSTDLQKPSGWSPSARVTT